MRDAIASDPAQAKAPLSSALESVAKACGLKVGEDDSDMGSLLSQPQLLQMLQVLELVDDEHEVQWKVETDERGCPWGYEEAMAAVTELFFANATSASTAAWPSTLITPEQHRERVVSDATEERFLHFNALVLRGFQALQKQRIKIQAAAVRSGLDITNLRAKFAPIANAMERTTFLKDGIRDSVQSYTETPSYSLRRRTEQVTYPVDFADDYKNRP